MNISCPDINSAVYKQFIGMINQKVSNMVVWLNANEIDYVWNYWVNAHLYRLYIPCKDLLFDFEYYPESNSEYNYIRINFDTNEIKLLEKLFPANILNTQDMEVWKLTQIACNHFLREQEVSPVYDKNVLRLGLVKDNTIYKCIVVKDDMIIRNATKSQFNIPYGTFILMRYLTEMFGFPEIKIKETLGNSYPHTLYRLIGMSVITQTNKKKIWWSPEGTKWKIKKEDTDKYIPFYYCGYRIYKYG